MIAPERREALTRAIEAVGDGTISAAELARLSEVSDPTAMTALKRAGFEQIKRGVWQRAKPETVYPEIEKAKSVAQVQQVTAAVAQERHFLDDADSWTVPVPKKLQAMADLMGLNIEVRVWKKP